MSIQSPRELESTRKNLKMLESRIRELDTEPIGNPHTRELTRRSLKKLVNQLKGEIACFEARIGPRVVCLSDRCKPDRFYRESMTRFHGMGEPIDMCRPSMKFCLTPTRGRRGKAWFAWSPESVLR